MNLKPLISLIVIPAAALCSCHSTPDGVIPPDDMAEVMADIHTAESVVETERRSYSDDSLRLILKQSVLARRGYTVADFDSSLSYYGHNIDLYAKLYDDIIAKLEKRIEKTEAQTSTDVSSGSMAAGEISLSVDGDSVDVWGLPRSIVFSPSSAVANVPFGLSTDRYWERGDHYTFRGRVSGASEPLTISLAVEYMDGSVEHLSIRAVGDGWKEVSFPTDSSRIARYVYGSLNYSTPRALPLNRMPAVIDSISLYRTRFSPATFRDPRMKSVGPRNAS